MDQAEVGNHAYPGVYAKMSKTPGRFRWPSPTLGEHNEYVLGNLLEMSEKEIAELAAENVIYALESFIFVLQILKNLKHQTASCNNRTASHLRCHFYRLYHLLIGSAAL